MMADEKNWETLQDQADASWSQLIARLHTVTSLIARCLIERDAEWVSSPEGHRSQIVAWAVLQTPGLPSLILPIMEQGESFGDFGLEGSKYQDHISITIRTSEGVFPLHIGREARLWLLNRQRLETRVLHIFRTREEAEQYRT